MSAVDKRGGAAPVAPAPAVRGAAEEGGGTIPKIVKSLATFAAIQLAIKYGTSFLKGDKAPAPSAPGASPNPSKLGQLATINAEPLWPLGTPLSMLLYTSTSPSGSDLQLKSPLVAWDGLTYGNWKDIREADLILDVPKAVRADNGSWWMDVLLVKGGGSDLTGKGPNDVAMYRKQLTRFFPKRKIRKEKKLIGSEEDASANEEAAEVATQNIAAHWSNNLTLSIVSDGGVVDINGAGPLLSQHYKLAPATINSTAKKYYPPVFPNDFWLLKENLYALNETSTTVPLHVTYQAMSSWKFQIFATMTQSMDDAAQQQGSGAEMDEVKRMLTETSPWLLITTGLVTVLHMLFEFLAFSSDIGHWRKKDKDLVGVSLNTILTNCFVQLVILLYLQDSSEETSFMILFGQGIGLLIEAWKITKVVDIRVRQDAKSMVGYQITFEDKKVLSEDEKKTQEYDRLAFRLVSYFAIPALLGYSVYSVMYLTHRGWYSFIVTTLAQAIYAFGFVQLVPQLIINYKLKSVAHMPMKAMMYKTLSTVVDDFFAFCIRMPWLHRLACFRDDVVFVILLYQRWIYRVDYGRVNEYGQVNEGMVEPVGETDGKAETKKTK